MQKSDNDNPSRREYRKPELREFGTIAELTSAFSNIGAKNDNGTTGKDKSVV